MENNKWIDYYSGSGEQKNWIIKEKEFDIFNQGKFETIFSQGNGYIGTRASLEEEYPNRRPGLFIASTFNQVAGPEVPELPNAANIWDIDITVNGQRFNMVSGELNSYERTINLRNGEVIRNVDWTSKEGSKLKLSFNRFVSMDDLHLMSTKTIIKAEQDSLLNIRTGINGQSTNSGAQHFEDTDATYKDGILEYVFTTTETKIDFVWNKKVNVYLNGEKIEFGGRLQSVYGYLRRQLMLSDNIQIKAGDELVIETISTVQTSRDIEYIDKVPSTDEIRKISKDKFKGILSSRYDELSEDSSNAWDKWWSNSEITIETDEDWDILATRFAQYNIRRFTPMHDWRANIEAKGFAGEEYKGHTFWDTEIFIWPYFLYTDPEVAKNLLRHRYFVKESAYIKGKEFGYEGMMWPWETTWDDKGEACPVWGGVDRKEGGRIKVWPAFNQLHIGACITWAIYQYNVATKDDDFMNKYGYEVFFDTARFWTNRLEYNEQLDRYEITKVTGPNEYKENIDNNAWTNYMVWFNLSKSLEYIEQIRDSEEFEKINSKIDLVKLEQQIKNVVDKIYLPQPNEDGIIPENDTFLQLKDVDMKYYKQNMDEFWSTYTFPEQNGLQTLKQADIVALMYTLGFLFDKETILKNWKYYEERCLHDSSLSLSMHTITANYAEDKTFAYEFFRKAAAIDIGHNMASCDNGIHAANVGGMLQAVIVGFGGIKNQNGEFAIDPNLPEKWDKLKFAFYLEGERVEITLTKNSAIFTKDDNGKEIKFKFRDSEVSITNTLEIEL